MKKGIIIIILIVAIATLFAFYHYNSTDLNSNIASSASGAVNYNNAQYGLTISLPLSWKGYTVLNENWTGQIIDSPTQEKIIGPKIIIRHPLWTVERPRQDIPIMIFNSNQWTLVQQEKISLGAAPIGPSKLYSNDNYIFATPARYNYAFLDGFEEVEQILNSQRR